MDPQNQPQNTVPASPPDQPQQPIQPPEEPTTPAEPVAQQANSVSQTDVQPGGVSSGEPVDASAFPSPMEDGGADVQTQPVSVQPSSDVPTPPSVGEAQAPTQPQTGEGVQPTITPVVPQPTAVPPATSPGVIPPNQPTSPLPQAAQPMVGGGLAPTPNSGMKKLVFGIVGVVLLLFVGVGLFVFLNSPSAFGNLEVRKGDGFNLKVPKDWSEKVNDDETTWYYDGESLEESTRGISVSVSPDTVPFYDEYTDKQKDQLIDLYKDEIKNSADNGVKFETFDATHPQADRITGLRVSGTWGALFLEEAKADEQKLDVKGEGILIFTDKGYGGVVVVAGDAPSFDKGIDDIHEIINSFEITR